MKKLTFVCVGFFLGSVFLLTLLFASPVQGNGGETPTPDPTVDKMSDPAAWAKPPPPGPTQADHGAYTYWMRCMVCHGDKGQGLALFRSYYPKEDQDCTNHRCHAGPQSLAGFTFPDAPAIMGPNTLVGFKTAADLYGFLSARMPRQDPGVLSSEEYWNLVAYLLKQRGALPDGVQLDATTASSIPVNPSPVAPIGFVVGGAGIIALLALGALWFRSKRRSPSAK